MEWQDFLIYPKDSGVVKSARARLAVRWWDIKDEDIHKRDPKLRRNRYRMTPRLIHPVGPNGEVSPQYSEPFEAMFVDESGGVVIWTKDAVWGLFRECEKIEKPLRMARHPPESEALGTAWQDFAVYQEAVWTKAQRIDTEGITKYSISGARADLRKNVKLCHVQRDEKDDLERMGIGEGGVVGIWTRNIVACIRGTGGYERIIKLPRHPSENIAGCYNYLPSPENGFEPNW